MISPILKLLNNQRNNADEREIQIARMKPFLRAVCSEDALLPKSIKDLSPHHRLKLKQLCTGLQETYQVFNAIAMIAPAYKDKDWYVIKRVYELTLNENGYCASDASASVALPSDPEIVCSVFCALLSYSSQNSKDLTHPHFFDNNATHKTISLLKPNDLAIQNSQPR